MALPLPLPRSLRWRLLVATFVATAVAVLLAGWLLSGLFREHVTRQFVATLTTELDQVTARFELDANGRPLLDPARLSDPRWTRPYSGLYWQIDEMAGAAPRRGVLRSRSLWDTELRAPTDAPADGEVHVHEVAGPGGAELLLVERTVRMAPGRGAAWRLLVAADRRDSAAAVAEFNRLLAGSLAVLLGLLMVAATAQVAMGLAPLKALRRGLNAVREGRQQFLEGEFPQEVQPLVDDFNGVLQRNTEIVVRARTQAGNLAHAIKTPLAVMAQGAISAQQHPETLVALPAFVTDQVEVVRRHVNWHLARSRAAAAQGMPGVRAEVAPVAQALVRVMSRVHAERGLQFDIAVVEPGLAFAGEEQDLQEMLGNLIDNACKWARSAVHIAASRVPEAATPQLRLVVEDDGPGITVEQRKQALSRGVRLDEATPGSGLGLAIVHELAELYGGHVTLGSGRLGGLKAELLLPRTRSAMPSTTVANRLVDDVAVTNYHAQP
ncbi:sensor histidine kinase [Azohydromonas caseinilytica]|uniref:histidine kinase n=1 Tax=Azohydromonas caseinilytica TaxID=2728836 RepID=A0A848FH13_9BURK|nr:sensor histidine kinase [Azohydromonas caseinilytica]NML18552.1 sensor histidine kinase [Azohydromonas caseinilytica]